MDAQECNELIKTWEEVLEQVRNINTNSDEIYKWEQRLAEEIKSLEELLMTPGLNVPDKLKFTNVIGVLKGIQVKLGCLFENDEGVQAREKISDRVRWTDLKSAFQERIKTGVITNLKHVDVMNAYMEDCRSLFCSHIQNVLVKEKNAVKVYMVLAAKFVVTRNDEEVLDTKYFNTKAEPIYPTASVSEWFNTTVREPILKEMEEFEQQGSGWSLHSIINLTVNVNKFNPMRAGSSYVKLPDEIRTKKACINVQNSDNMCFKWAILSYLHPGRRSFTNLVSEYQRYEDVLNFTGIEFPVQPTQVSKFERQNDVSVNVFILKKRKGKFTTSPLHVTCAMKPKHVNLLLVQDHYVDEEEEKNNDNDEDDYVYHYVWIKDLSRLLSTQLSKRNHRHHICDRCLNYFRYKHMLDTHENDCKVVNKCKVTMPTPQNKILHFRNHCNKERVPFIVYADLECLLKPTRDENAYQQHEAFSIGYYLKCSYDQSLSRYRAYRGEKPAEWFVQELKQLANDVQKIHMNPKPMQRLSQQQQQQFRTATSCHICKKPMSTSDRLRDHCHLTGRYRGPAHNGCNINYQDSRTIPVVFHNLTGYDSHFIIKEIALSFEGRVDILPQTKEKYISFTKHIDGSDMSFRFIDSFRFMASSLEKLASYLTELRIVRSEFSTISDDKFNLLKRKGVFPYEYVDALAKLDQTSLPTKKDFHSTLNGCDILDKDYEHAKRVWDAFNIDDLGAYSDLYLKTDVLLLADVFENFRDNSIKAYGLDPAHYYTTPGFTWDAMLKYTKIELELLTDLDMHMFIERGVRGGVSQCCNRYARANNRYMRDYDPQEDTKYLMYYDVNNLYGWAMMESLPYGGFEWVENLQMIDFDKTPDDSPEGYILEVDLEYPETRHDAHKDLPLCPEKKCAPGSTQQKLMTTLDSKTCYILHYRNLKQVLKYGLKLTHIHRALKFRQKPWLKSYIDLNTDMRKQAKNDFEKNLFKLMNNAVFGKTIENVRKHATVKLVTHWEGRYGAEALIGKPNFHSHSVFEENLVAIQLTNTDVYLNKPIYVGVCVLELSKILVYDFHYDYMKPQFGNDRCKLLYTDTDSLLYEIRCLDIYDIMIRDIKKFDTSDYPAGNQFSMPQENKKEVGLMKDEFNGQIMTEFVGLRSKMYSVRVDGKDRIKRVKGIKTGVVERTITFDDFLQCLLKNTKQEREQRVIRSRMHNVYTERQVKVALSPNDDKRFIPSGSTDTLPWGHYAIPQASSQPAPEVRRSTESSTNERADTPTQTADGRGDSE